MPQGVFFKPSETRALLRTLAQGSLTYRAKDRRGRFRAVTFSSFIEAWGCLRHMAFDTKTKLPELTDLCNAYLLNRVARLSGRKSRA